MWSPKVDTDGKRNQSYDFMTEVRPGDVVFAYADTLIRAVGIAQSGGYFFPKPDKFEKASTDWNQSGWRVDVAFQPASPPISPRDHLEKIAPLLPPKYSPINRNGFGNQKIYLARISREIALVLSVGLDAQLREEIAAPTVEEADWGSPGLPEGNQRWNQHELNRLLENPSISDTTREMLIKARLGQGRFKKNVFELEKRCRVTQVSNTEFLIASHIKPWRASTNEERLDGANGLMLTPSVDRLFDRGYISFQDDGSLIVSPRADRIALEGMGIVESKVHPVPFTEAQKKYLEFHRKEVFVVAHERKHRVRTH